MYDHTQLMFLFCETPLHAGVGAGLGAVDLPIQRERATGYPTIQGSGVKGAVRSIMPQDDNTDAVFGPEVQDGGAPGWAGSISFGDARILAFPVRSLQGVFVWVTCLDVLARLQRELEQMGVQNIFKLPADPPGEESAYVAATQGPYSPVIAQRNRVYLEEFDFTVTENGEVAGIAEWLAENALSSQYAYWQRRMEKSLVILHDASFRDFVQFSTEVVTRVALLTDTKTVKQGALWTEENLPTDTLMYAPVRASELRVPTNKRNGLNAALNDPKSLVDWVKGKAGERIQIGGDETIGRGIVGLKWLEG